MIVFPNCKINLGLHITAKRPDGYHNLETVFLPIALRDALELIPGTGETPVQFSSTGLPINGNPAQNLCVKAWHLLKKDFPRLPSVRMHLHKNIPMGAGLGGGSADGAFTLQLLNRRFQLQLDVQQLLYYALQLGSDCPFFILDQPAFARGRGEELELLPLDLSSYRLVLVHPRIHIGTAWAFAQATPRTPAVSLPQVVALPVTEWRHQLQNDFEPPVLQHYPELAQLKTELYRSGALYAAMSGSGSCFFGIYPGNAEISVNLPPRYLVYKTSVN